MAAREKAVKERERERERERLQRQQKSVKEKADVVTGVRVEEDERRSFHHCSSLNPPLSACRACPVVLFLSFSLSRRHVSEKSVCFDVEQRYVPSLSLSLCVCVFCRDQ